MKTKLKKVLIAIDNFLENPVTGTIVYGAWFFYFLFSGIVYMNQGNTGFVIICFVMATLDFVIATLRIKSFIKKA